MRHVLPETVVEVDNLLPPLDGVVRMQREGVVALDEPAELVFEAPVVGLIYYLLLVPISDRVCPAHSEQAPQAFRLFEQVSPPLYQVTQHPGRLLVDAGVRLDLAVYELAGVVTFGGSGEDLLGAAGELGSLGIGEPELFFGPQGTLPHVLLEGVLWDHGPLPSTARNLSLVLVALSHKPSLCLPPLVRRRNSTARFVRRWGGGRML